MVEVGPSFFLSKEEIEEYELKQLFLLGLVHINCCPWCGKELPLPLEVLYYCALSMDYGLYDAWDYHHSGIFGKGSV